MNEPIDPLAIPDSDERTPRRHRKSRDLPDDPALPGLVTIRASGLAAAVPASCLGEGPVEVLLRGHTRGKRATLEVRAGERHFAVKLYAEDPAAEAALYEAIAAEPQTTAAAARVPQLLAWDREARLLVIGWLEGPSARDLVEIGRGERAGELGAIWLHRAAALPVSMGPPTGARHMVKRLGKWAAALGGADPVLGDEAARVSEILERTRPEDGDARLLNGRLYARHVLDTGDGVGVIDWDNFGQGPLEFDAGMFLASIARTRMGHETLAIQAARAEETFMAATERLLDDSVLAWHRAAALLCLAYHRLERKHGDWVAREAALLEEAGKLVIGVSRAVHAMSPALEEQMQTSGRAVEGSRATEARRWSHYPDLAVLQILWARGEATAHELTTNANQLSRLEKRGVITHRVAGRRNVYRAAVDAAEIRRSVVEDFASVTDDLFQGDVAALVCQLIKARDVKPEDLARVIALLKERERELGGERT